MVGIGLIFNMDEETTTTKLIKYARQWHEHHTPEYLSEDLGLDDDETCEVYEALQQYDQGLINDAALIKAFKGVDAEGYENALEESGLGFLG